MANHASTKKAIRKTKRNTIINTNKRSCIKTYIKKVIIAITTSNIDDAKNALVKAQSEIMKGVSRKIITKNAASRKISRLSAQIKRLGTQAQEKKL